MGLEDYFKKQIDQLGKVLAQLIADMIGLKAQGQETEMVAVVDKALKNELGLDISALIAIPQDQFINELKSQTDINDSNLNSLAEILFNITIEHQNKEIKDKLLIRTLKIYEYLEKNDKTFSMDRHFKIEQIKREI
jgi:hypothetical protein